jgi:hypothetical protein
MKLNSMTAPSLSKAVEDRFSIDGAIKRLNLNRPRNKSLLFAEKNDLLILLYEYLKISPSYQWVHEKKIESLTSSEKEFDSEETYGLSADRNTYTYRGVWDVRKAPEQYELLIKNYHSLKNAHKLDFIKWRNEVLIMPLRNKPYVSVEYVWVHLAKDYQYSDEEALEIACKNLRDIFYESIKEDSAYIKIPLNDNKKSVMKDIESKLDMYSLLKRKNSIDERINLNALKKGLTLLKNKAKHPELEQWRIGLMSDVSPTHSKLLSSNAKRKVSSIDEKESRDTLGKLTSRALRKYESIAENAARGRFPSEFPKSKIKFDYLEIGKRF